MFRAAWTVTSKFQHPHLYRITYADHFPSIPLRSAFLSAIPDQESVSTQKQCCPQPGPTSIPNQNARTAAPIQCRSQAETPLMNVPAKSQANDELISFSAVCSRLIHARINVWSPGSSPQ